jgi:succinate dehydrogenase flavin-adding protein (antitoxin of CptAB toxin-antitoxin module)
LLLYLKKKYPNLCSNQISTFQENLSEKDWELFYDVSGNKSKRCYSPKARTDPEEEENIMITSSILDDEKPKTLSVRQNA